MARGNIVTSQTSYALILRIGILFIIAAVVNNQNITYPEAPFANGCRIIFSEFNLNSGNEQFIELGRACAFEDSMDERRASLNKFKILFISHDENLLGVCSLHGITMLKRYWFYVIGMRGINNLNMDIAECNIATIVIPGDIQTLPKAVAFPIAIALVRNQKESVLKQLKLISDGTNYFETKITDGMLQTIQNNIQDFYILGSSTPFTFCEYFTKIYSFYDRNRNSFLRDWEGTTESVDKSLNRCVSTAKRELTSYPMQPESFLHSYATPGRLNNCKDGVQLIKKANSSKRPRLQSSSCTSEFETQDEAIDFLENPDTYHIVTSGRSTVFSDHTYASKESEIFKPHKVEYKVFEKNLEEMSPFIWNDCSRFPPMSFMHLQNLDFNPYDATVIANVSYCPWIEYLSSSKKIRCKWCNVLLNQKILVDRNGSPFITDIMKLGTGMTNVNNTVAASKARSSNRKKITDHNENRFHKMSEQYFRLYDSGLRGTNLAKEFEKPGGNYRNFFKATENVAVLAIQSLRMSVSFRSYKLMTETINYFGADIGHLYQTHSSLGTLANALGKYLHKNLTQYLLKAQPEISVTLDSTTDVSGRSVLAIVFKA